MQTADSTFETKEWLKAWAASIGDEVKIGENIHGVLPVQAREEHLALHEADDEDHLRRRRHRYEYRHRHVLRRDGRLREKADPLRHQHALEGPRRHEQLGRHRRRRL